MTDAERAELRGFVDCVFNEARKREQAGIAAAYAHYHATKDVEASEAIQRRAFDAYKAETSDELIRWLWEHRVK